jgi:glycosyltransferase involved in cell wall biosynthesis
VVFTGNLLLTTICFSLITVMKIGLIIYGRLDTISGGYLYDRQLVDYLQAQGDTVELISLPWEGYGRHLLHNFWFALQEQLRQAEFDILLQDELNHPSLFWLNRRLRGELRYPIVSIVHHLRCSEARSRWQNWLYRLVEQRYLASVDGFIFNSQTTRQVVQALVGDSQAQVVALPAGDRLQPAIAAEQIELRAQRPGPLCLLFVGNLIPRKGLHVLLEAAAGLPRIEWQLAVVGDTAVSPRYTRQIQQAINQHDLKDNVTLHGPFSDDELAAQMAQSQVLVVPSSYEGFGIVYLEGMSFGLPAIAGRGGAAHEIITEGVDGFLVEDAEMLRQHLHSLHHNRTQLAQMSLAAQKRFTNHPTWAASMSHIRQFLPSVIHAQADHKNGYPPARV